MGQNSQTTQQNQQQTTNPWAPAVPALTNILGQLGGIGTGVTNSQSNALSSLGSLANSLPMVGPAAAGALANLFSSNTSPAQGLWSGAYNALQNTLSPFTNPNNLNPTNTPGLSTSLADLNRSITNNITGMWAGSGRDPSGNADASRNLAQGLAAGEAPLLTSQYNTNVGNYFNAANQLFGGAGTTAQGVTNLQQLPLQNALQAYGAAGALPGLWTQPATTALSAANIGYQLPYENISQYLSPVQSIAGLGGQSTGSGTSTTTQPVNPLSTGLGLGLSLMSMGMPGGGSLGGSMLGGLGSGLQSLITSDERLKDDVQQIGLLYSGLPVYRFRYKGDPTVRTGLMAQDVEQVDPGAVHEVGLWPGGPTFKAVDYDRATAMAA